MLARAASHAGRRLSERRIRERVQRVPELTQLAGDEREAVLLLRCPVQALELVRDAIEPFEERIELTVADVFRLHEADSTR